MDKWQNVDGKGANMLDEFYSNPQRFAYTFQNYVFVTRVMQVMSTCLLGPCMNCLVSRATDALATLYSLLACWQHRC